MTFETVVIWAFRLLFFAALWLVIRRLGQIMTQGQQAAERFEKDGARRKLDDMTQLMAAFERRQAALADTVEERTQSAAKAVEEKFGIIDAKIEETKQLTIAAADASAKASNDANHMNEKLGESHKNVIETIIGLHQPSVVVEVGSTAPAVEKKKKGDR